MDALKRTEAGISVPDLCRELGVSTATFYEWLPRLSRALTAVSGLPDSHGEKSSQLDSSGRLPDVSSLKRRDVSYGRALIGAAQRAG
jgi:hypothetical protein